MGDVWAIFPSANPQAAETCCAMWHNAGYSVAVALDRGSTIHGADHVIEIDYTGYPDAIARLIAAVKPNIAVCIGDDLRPDQNSCVDVIAAQFRERFPDLNGVMQPMGDAYGALAPGAQRAAVSPWIGRGFVAATYGGTGPYFPGYHHLYCDAELWDVADRAGVLWQRDDLTQYHAHWGRGHEDTLNTAARGRIVASQRADADLFQRRRAAGYPGALN